MKERREASWWHWLCWKVHLRCPKWSSSCYVLCVLWTNFELKSAVHLSILLFSNSALLIVILKRLNSLIYLILVRFSVSHKNIRFLWTNIDCFGQKMSLYVFTYASLLIYQNLYFFAHLGIEYGFQCTLVWPVLTPNQTSIESYQD